MIPERDQFLVKHELRRRHQQAAEERAAREARRAVAEARHEQIQPGEGSRGAFGWLRRLAGARQ